MSEERVKNIYDAFTKLIGKVDWIQGVGIGGSPSSPKVVVLVKDKDSIVKAKTEISTMMATDDIVEIVEIGDVRALPFFPFKERGGKIKGLDR